MTESYRDKLNEIDHKCLNEDLKFYDLRSLFESVAPKLSAEDKEEIKKVIQNTNDAETIAAVLQAKAMDEKNESLEEDTDSLQISIFDFLDNLDGYTDYNQKIEEVSDEFGMSPDEAENYVWDWTLNSDAEWHDEADKEEFLDEKLVDAPQEVINKLIEILGNHGFILDDSFKVNPGKTFMGAIHLQVVNPESIIEDSDEIDIQDQLQKYVTRELIDDIHKLDRESNCPITWNFGPNKNGQVTGGLDIMKQYVEEKLHETWADEKYDSLMKKGKENWDQDDWDAYNYIMNAWGENGYFDESFKTRRKNYCPHCTNNTLIEVEDGYYVCDECGAEYTGYPSFEGGLELEPIDEGLSDDTNKVFIVKYNNWHPFNGWVELMDKVDSNGEGEKYKFLNHEELNDFTKELVKQGYKNYQGYPHLNEASYGGVFDIEDDIYFTRDDLSEFLDILIDKLDNYFGYSFDVYDAYLSDPTHFWIILIDENHDINISYDFKIDMRRIRKPSDLQRYIPQAFEYFVKEYQNEYNQYDFDESLNEDNLAKPIKKDIKNAYRYFDRRRDFIRKKNAKNIKKIDDMDASQEDKDKIKNVILDKEPTFKFNNNYGKLETKDYPYYVTYYVEVPYYHPEEGGYYVAGMSAEQSEGFDSKQDAIKAAEELADELDMQKIGPSSYQLKSKYIGENEYIYVENSKNYLNKQKGDTAYESLEEDTIKQNGKWVNKGKEGTHGKFATKKAADAQRKAMFANGYKEDWNFEDQIAAPDAVGKLNPGDKFKNRKGVEVTIIEPQQDGTIQYKIDDEVRSGSEKSIQQMLYRNNYLRLDEAYKHLNNRDKQIYIDEIEKCEDREDLEDIVHEIFFYDKALFAMMNRFPKNASFEELKANKIAILKDSMLTEDYQHKIDEWGEPYSYDEVERELKSITNNWTDKDGTIRCYWEQEKNYGLQILKKHYNYVETSDGRTGKGEDMSWVLAYSGLKEE